MNILSCSVICRFLTVMIPKNVLFFVRRNIFVNIIQLLTKVMLHQFKFLNKEKPLSVNWKIFLFRFLFLKIKNNIDPCRCFSVLKQDDNTQYRTTQEQGSYCFTICKLIDKLIAALLFQDKAGIIILRMDYYTTNRHFFILTNSIKHLTIGI